MRAIAGIILSAGSSRRFGEDKLTQLVDGKILVAHVVEAALMAHLDEIVLVTRAGDEVIPSALPLAPRLRVVENLDHLEGMSSSLKCGLRALGDSIDAAMVLLGDEPEITPNQIQAMIQAYLVSGAQALRASYQGRVGHPVVLARALWPDLLLEEGDIGARRILEKTSGIEVVEVGGRAPIDVDTREDLAALRRRLSRM